MVLIRTREGAGGTKYQVIVRRADHTTISRTFRRLIDAKDWAQLEKRRIKAEMAKATGGTHGSAVG